jgi:hypothetical protein
MTAPRSRAAGEYLRFLGWAVAVTLAVALLGYAPTRRLGGEAALLGLVAGCGIGLVAAAAGALPIARARGAAPAAQYRALAAAIGLRFGLTVALALAAALSGRLERPALLVWVAIGYMALLVVDTRFAWKMVGPGARGNESGNESGRDGDR